MKKNPFGYTEREWQFLQLTAEWSGYFLPRQFDIYSGGSPGAVTHSLVQKLLSRGHATVTTHARNAHLYHLFSRPLYAALGQEDNRHRRKRPAHQVRVKLMALDFVLAHRELRFLPSENEKVGCCVEAGIPTDVLPRRCYHAKSGAKTTRYFLDKFPVFLCDGKLFFTFISGDTSSRDPFLNFLTEYWPLFSAFRSIPLRFVTSKEEIAEQAGADLRTYLEKNRGSGSSAITEFFSLRKRHESRLAELSMAELRVLRAGFQRYNTSRHDALYRAWVDGKEANCQTLDVRFDVAVLPHCYGLFGDL